ncbi:MAG: UvrD-helicase domain-containing protein, partial [Desulfobacteraceae bacterium]|nr:UvrD-helicase domain-containing protein [Desulfobacteraceae bacterium]
MMKPLDPFTIDLEKTTLIEASAGTGKTYTITTLLCRLVAMGYAVDTILVVTFTEAAAAELKLRIRNRLSRCLDFLENQRPDEDDELAGFLKGQKDAGLIRQRIRNAINDFDLSAIMTIHAFCLQSLKENAFESASYFDITLSPGNAPYLKQVCQDFFVKEVYGLPPIFLRFLKTKGFTQENVMSPFSKAVSRPDIRTVPLEQEFCDVCDQYRDLVKKIGDLLKGSMDEIIDLFLSHKGIDKRSYNKKWVPQWLKDALNTIEASRSRDILFTMTEKGDSLYKFTRSRLASKTKEGASPPFHELFDLCEELLDLYTIFEKNLISLKIRLISFIHGEFEKIKQTRGICFFDDLVNDLAKALNGELAEPLIKNCQKRYRACLIDEFQDTDPIQYFIFSKLFGNTHRPFFMIGDPKQAIYAFRGGDIFAYLCACKQSDQRFTLDKNFRSSPLLVKAVNQIFSHADNPFLFEDIEFVNVSTPEFSRDLLIENETAAVPLNVCFVPAPANGPDPKTIIAKDAALKMVPRVLAHQIIQLLNSDKRLRKADNGYRQITPGDIGVLVRTNAQAQMVQQALTLVGVPSFLSKTGSVFETKEAMDMLDLLCAVQEPGNMGLLKAALCTGIFNYSGNMIADIEKDEQQIMFWLERFYEFKETWDNKGFISMIQSVFHWDSAFLNPDNPLSERVLTNFYHLSELIAQEALQKHLGAFYLLKWFKAQLIKEFREETAEELRLESDKQAVAIVTIHKSKGLEYPIVYLPYLWEMGGGRQKNREVFFHDPKEDYLLKLDLGSNALEAASDLAAIEEEAEQRRLLYVALTRAAAMCTVIWGHFKGVENSSLGALLHPKGCKDDDSMLADLELLYKNNEQS